MSAPNVEGNGSASTADADDLRMTDPHFYIGHEHHDLFRRLRRDDPVHWTTGNYPNGFWSVTKHRIITDVYSDPLRFSSQHTAFLPTGEEFAPERKQRIVELRRAGSMLIHCDPPRHQLMREAMQDPLLIKAVNHRTEEIREVVRDLVQTFVSAGGGDFVGKVAAPLPISVIFGAMDIPVSDWPRLFRLANMITAPDDREYSIGTPVATKEYGAAEMLSYCIEIGRERRKRLGEDIISHLVRATVDGQALTEDEVGVNVYMLVIAGQETTRNSLSGGLLALMERPDELERVRTQRKLLKAAPDEFVRWVTPITHLMRTATRDTELAGRKIREGDWVVCWNVSANRDEEVFGDPDRFDIGRARNRHLGFGIGEHFCLGVHLARLELRLALEALLDHAGNFRVVGPVERAPSLTFAGIKRLPIEIAAA